MADATNSNDDTTSKFELTDANWAVWSAKMSAVLIKKKLWRAVIQPARAYPEMHNAAQAEMILRVQDQLILAIEDSPNAAQAWNKLRRMHKRSGPSTRMIYRQALASLKKDREESLNTYVNRVARIMRGLAATGAPIQN